MYLEYSTRLSCHINYNNIYNLIKTTKQLFYLSLITQKLVVTYHKSDYRCNTVKNMASICVEVYDKKTTVSLLYSSKEHSYYDFIIGRCT